MPSIRDLFILIAILVSIPICLLRPTYGVVAWAVMAFANPQSMGWGFVQHIQPALLIAVPTLVGFLFFGRNWGALKNREVVLLFILWIWFTLTTLNSDSDPAFMEKAASAWYRWQMISKILLMVIVTIATLNTWNRLRLLVLGVAGSFAYLVLKNLPIMIISDGASRVYGPDFSMIADNNDFGLALNMVLPIFFFLARTESRPRTRKLMFFLFVATIPTIFFTYSRGALVGLVVVAGMMLLQLKQSWRLLPVLLAGLAFAVYFAPENWRDRMTLTESDKLLDKSALSRINAWTYSWRLACDYPLMGGGFDAFTPSLFAKYAPDPTDVHAAHSIYFGLMAEHGFVGLLLYLTLVASCLLSLRRISKRARAMNTPNIEEYAKMLSLSLIGFLTCGAFLGRAYFDLFFTIVACVAVLSYVSRQEWAEIKQAREEEEDEEEASSPMVVNRLGSPMQTTA